MGIKIRTIPTTNNEIEHNHTPITETCNLRLGGYVTYHWKHDDVSFIMDNSANCNIINLSFVFKCLFLIDHRSWFVFVGLDLCWLVLICDRQEPLNCMICRFPINICPSHTLLIEESGSSF
jgi:hypothetical protein